MPTPSQVDPNQIIADVHHVHWVPRSGGTFQVNTLPEDYEWEQCSVQICNTASGPSNCQVNYSPGLPWDSTKFLLGVDSSETVLTVEAYDNLDKPVLGGVYSIGPMFTRPPKSDDMIVLKSSPSVVSGPAGPGFSWSPTGSDYLPTVGVAISVNTYTITDSLSGSIPLKPDSQDYLEPYSSFFPSCACYDSHIYPTCRTTISYPRFGDFSTPAGHTHKQVRSSLPLQQGTLFYDQWSVRQKTFRYRPSGPEWTVYYDISHSVLGSGLVSQNALVPLVQPDDSHLVGNFFGTEPGDVDDPNWRPWTQLGLVRLAGGYGFDAFAPSPRIIGRTAGRNVVSGGIYQDHAVKYAQWEFCGGKLSQFVGGVHNWQGIGSRRWWYSRITYDGWENYSRVWPVRDTQEGYKIFTNGPTHYRPTFSGTDPKFVIGSSATRRYNQANEPPDEPPLGWPLPINIPSGITAHVDLNYTITYGGETSYLGPPAFGQSSQWPNPEYDNKTTIFGLPTENPGPWLQSAGYPENAVPSPIMTVRGRVFRSTDDTDWNDTSTALKLTKLPTSSNTEGAVLQFSANTHLYDSDVPIQVFPGYEDVYDLPGPHYGLSSFGYFSTATPRRATSWAHDTHNLIVSMTVPDDFKWVRIYDA